MNGKSAINFTVSFRAWDEPCLMRSLALFPNYQDWTSLKNRENFSEFGHQDQIRSDRKVPIEVTGRHDIARISKYIKTICNFCGPLALLHFVITTISFCLFLSITNIKIIYPFFS